MLTSLALAYLASYRPSSSVVTETPVAVETKASEATPVPGPPPASAPTDAKPDAPAKSQ
jgi:hypothetical protein